MVNVAGRSTILHFHKTNNIASTSSSPSYCSFVFCILNKPVQPGGFLSSPFWGGLSEGGGRAIPERLQQGNDDEDDKEDSCRSPLGEDFQTEIGILPGL